MKKKSSASQFSHFKWSCLKDYPPSRYNAREDRMDLMPAEESKRLLNQGQAFDAMAEALSESKCFWYPNTDICNARPCKRCAALKLVQEAKSV